jgi:hypothetical protein
MMWGPAVARVAADLATTGTTTWSTSRISGWIGSTRRAGAGSRRPDRAAVPARAADDEALIVPTGAG